MENINEAIVAEEKKALTDKGKVRRTGRIMLLVSALLIVAGTALSAVTAAFTDTAMETADILAYILGSFVTIFVILLPDCMMFSMINKGGIKPVKSAFAVIINVVMFFVLLLAAAQTTGGIRPVILLSLFAVYLSDVYLTVCLIIRRTKHFTVKTIKALSYTGIVFTAAAFVGVVACVVKLISESAGTDLLTLLSTYYTSIMYFLGNTLFVFSGVLSLNTEDYIRA